MEMMVMAVAGTLAGAGAVVVVTLLSDVRQIVRPSCAAMTPNPHHCHMFGRILISTVVHGCSAIATLAKCCEDAFRIPQPYRAPSGAMRQRV